MFSKAVRLEYYASDYVWAHHSGSYIITLECGHEEHRKASIVKNNTTGKYRCQECSQPPSPERSEWYDV